MNASYGSYWVAANPQHSSKSDHFGASAGVPDPSAYAEKRRSHEAPIGFAIEARYRVWGVADFGVFTTVIGLTSLYAEKVSSCELRCPYTSSKPIATAIRFAEIGAVYVQVGLLIDL
jgi:hypothetical protein